MPNNAALPIVHTGALDLSAVNDFMSFAQQDAILLSTPLVTNVNPTAATNLMTGVIRAGTLNSVGKGLEIFAAGTYSVGAASTMTFTVALGSVTLASWVTASQATTGVTLAWSIQGWGSVTTNGTAGTIEFHGALAFDSGATLAAACSTFLDSNVAVSSALNLAIDNTLAVTALFGTGNGASTVTERILEVVICN